MAKCSFCGVNERSIKYTPLAGSDGYCSLACFCQGLKKRNFYIIVIFGSLGYVTYIIDFGVFEILSFFLIPLLMVPSIVGLILLVIGFFTKNKALENRSKFDVNDKHLYPDMDREEPGP